MPHITKAHILLATAAVSVAALLADYISQNPQRSTPLTIVSVQHWWATWCPPCVTEIPALLQAAKQNPQVPFYLHAVNNTPADVTTFLKRYQPLPTNISLTYVPSQPNNLPLPTTALILAGQPSPTVLNGPASWNTMFR